MNNVKKKKLLIIDSEQNCKELCNILSGEYDISAVKNFREVITAFGLQDEFIIILPSTSKEAAMLDMLLNPILSSDGTGLCLYKTVI